MANDPELYQHKEWLGLLQPEGLVVSPPALVKAQAFVDRAKMVELQPVLQGLVSQDRLSGAEALWVPDFVAFVEQVLGWEADDLVGAERLPAILEVVLTDYGETLKPSYAVADPDSDGWLLLVQAVPPGHDLDQNDPTVGEGQGWKATYQQKFERLLRGTKVPIGLLWNGTHLRLVYAPSGESSGHVTFPMAAMAEVPGRLILGALEMLLGADRLFNAPTGRTLPKLLEESRNYQAEVSTKLAAQVLDALWELLRGFQAADAEANDKLLSALTQPEQGGGKAGCQHIYGGLITTLMRLVFLLYAEDEGLMPDDTIYQRHYAVSGLYEKLRADAGTYPDTMDQRYGAWSALLSLFRLVYDGGGAYEAYLPARHGQLFDPDEYPFLEGRPQGTTYQTYGSPEAPRIADGVVWHVLEKLLVLEGDRLSYRALDVEQIGSVYEAIMGYEVEVAEGLSIAVKPKDVVISVEALLSEKPALKEAQTPAELVAALGSRVSPRTTSLLHPGNLYLQPGEERRRTGSHYTPRKLTQPIVETTLRPVLEALGEHPTAEQILDLKVCDLAMGSAAFLVEVCRQLAEQVVAAWDYHGQPENLPDAVEPVLYARRLVAQRCLYGVDKNPFAVNLAKLSLWLVTLAKDQPFTFVDHALKCGDSLVGLTQAEIGSFGANAAYEPTFFEDHKQLITQSATKALAFRRAIQTSDTRTDADTDQKQALLKDVDQTLEPARLTAKVAIASFFAGGNAKQRQQNREAFGGKLIGYEKGLVDAAEIQAVVGKLTTGTKVITPFNWELEFPEVFDRESPGFDAIVGNPPFAGKNTTINANPEGYLDWLKEVHPESHGNADLVTHFFRRAFNIIRKDGTFGLISTNTISQGDTRSTGLRFICNHGGTIYNAQKRVKWPGLAAVVISIVNIFKGTYIGRKAIDDQETDLISAFLFHTGGNNDPEVLLANQGKSFIGSYILGMGFTFDDSNPEATSIAEMYHLIKKDPRNSERISPYIGGDEVNSSPTHSYHRYVIDFFNRSEEEVWNWPDLMQIVKDKVKPIRDSQKRDALRERWWQYAEKRPGLVRAIAECDRILAISRVRATGFTFLPSSMVFSEQLVIFPFEKTSAFCILQSHIHEIWAYFFSSTALDLIRYSPSDCFETFPFPTNWETDPTLEAIGKTYYDFRADLMVRTNQGLTDTYNDFHNPTHHTPDILKLRDLHEQMDRSVLNAYGWHDIDTTCGYALDYLDIDPDDLPPEAAERVASGDLFFPTAAEAAAFDALVRSGSGKRGKSKLPWRYRWPEATHDEVLARLLDLNQKRHEEEILGGKQATAPRPSQSKRRRTINDAPTIPGLEL